MTESSFTNLSRDLGYIDLCFQGNRQVIATAVIHRLAGTVLVDPGPTTCLTTLRETLAQRGIGIRDLDAVLLTHIHLDHAGATGASFERTLVSRCTSTNGVLATWLTRPDS